MSETAGAERKRLRILFLMWSVNYDRLFEASLRELLARGHQVEILFETDKDGVSGDSALFEELQRESGGLTWSLAPPRTARLRAWWRRQLRLTLDLLRYYEPEYRGASALRARAAGRAPRIVSRLIRSPVGGIPVLRRLAATTVRTLERRLAADPAVSDVLNERRPDLVVATPLVMLGSNQGEYIRAARALGIPTAFLVASWDNLTNKGLVHDEPDLTVVWNEAQRREATDLHGLPPGSVVAVGAHSYDHWFEWRPSRTRNELCAELGLDPARPMLLYACSSPFISPQEATSVRRWLAGLRAAADPILAGASVVVRPHPANPQPWRAAGVGEDGRTVVWPPDGAKPTAAQAKRDYFDTLAHADAVVGINTSTLVESAIVGRPTYTLLDPTQRGAQEGTLHFAHLSALRCAHTTDEHFADLAAALRTPPADGREKTFVANFLRPLGVDRPAAPALVAELELLASGARVPPPRTILFVLDHPGFLLHFDATIAVLAARGHTIHVAFSRPDKWPHGLEAIDRSDSQIVVHDRIPGRTATPRLARGVRRLADYVHYLDPALADAVYARAKWRRLARFPGPLAALERRDTLARPVVGLLLGFLAFAERVLPSDRPIERFISELRPDAVAVSPLVDARTDLTDYVEAAGRLGLPSALCVASWDNLSSKGLVRAVPDRVSVWNETQRSEAVRFHRLSAERIVITGAQSYDRWFDRRPVKTAAEVAGRYGLPEAAPLILFAGSTRQRQTEALEPSFVRNWIEALRASGRPEIAGAGVLVRPHPTNAEAWASFDTTGLGPVTVWIRDRGLPVTDDDRAEYFEALHHAVAVVAINSTTLIEATILDTPAHTVALPEFRELQGDLLHYGYLLPENGGPLVEARTLDEHVRLLADDVADPGRNAPRRRAFVESFIRPFGLDQPATPRLVAFLERLADYR